jgi:hypothetical protein
MGAQAHERATDIPSGTHLEDVMSTDTETQTPRAVTEEAGSWRGAVVAGIAGGAVMGVLMSLMNSAVLAVAIPGLYGLAPPANGIAGWFVHLSHGAVLGVVFAGLLSIPALREATGSALRTTIAGLVYGVVIWIVLAALVMPVWLGAVGFPSPPPFPNFAVPSLLWHLVYGAVLGAVFPAVEGL